MRKIKLYLNIALLLMVHEVYGAAAAGDPVNSVTTAVAGAGATSTGDPAPYDFEARATKMLAEEPYKSRHASDCEVLNIHSFVSTGVYKHTGTFMITDTGKPFVLICRHSLEQTIRDIIVRFSDGAFYFAKAHMLPSPNPYINPCFEEGFVRKGDHKEPVTIHIVNGKAINYSHPYFAWDDAVTVIRADGREEVLPGLDTLPADARRDRISLMRDYAVLILEAYPVGIAPAKIAFADSVPIPKTIHGDDWIDEIARAHSETTTPIPQKRIPCSLSGYGCLVEGKPEYTFALKSQDPNKLKQSFRLLDIELCEKQPIVHHWQTSNGMNLPSMGALMGPYGFRGPLDGTGYHIILAKLLPDNRVIVQGFARETVGLSSPIFGGFSGASLRDDATGEVIGIYSGHLGSDFGEYPMIYDIYHTLIPERDRIHAMVDGYYAEETRIRKVRSVADGHYAAKAAQEKEVRAEAEALKSSPYSPSDMDYRLWAF